MFRAGLLEKVEGLCEGLGRFEMYRFFGFVRLAIVFSRFVFRFAKVCVGEMIDSCIFCKAVCCDSYVFESLKCRSDVYVHNFSCGMWFCKCLIPFGFYVFPKACVSVCDVRC